MDALEYRTRQLTEGALLPALLRLALPVTASVTLQTIYQLVNAFWLGRVGATAVAVIAVTTPLSLLLLVAGSGLAIAGSILVAQFSGARNRAMVNRAAAQTIVMMVGISVILSLIGLLLAAPVLRAMAVPTEVLAGATLYLRISYAGLTATYAFVMCQSILQGAGEVRFPLIVVTASVLLNAALDPLLIFGWGPVPPMGVAGAAWATVAAQAAAAAVGILPLFTGRYGVRIRVADFKPDAKLIMLALTKGLPASVEQSTRTLATLLLAGLAARFGTTALAAYGIGVRIIVMFFIPALGLATATATLVGQNLGAGQPERARRTASVSAWLAFVGLTGAALLFLPVAAAVTHFLVPTDDTVAQLAASFVRVATPAMGLAAAQQALAGAFRGAGQTLAAMAFSLVMMWGCQLPISLYLSKYTSAGFAGVWWGFPISNAAALLITVVWFRRSTWKSIPQNAPAMVRA